uniref:Uncharacterized protein n=1 Tax=Magallana gigas TaxID=29159 RepID=A0A8W8JRX9_MAGGI
MLDSVSNRNSSLPKPSPYSPPTCDMSRDIFQSTRKGLVPSPPVASAAMTLKEERLWRPWLSTFGPPGKAAMTPNYQSAGLTARRNPQHMCMLTNGAWTLYIVFGDRDNGKPEVGVIHCNVPQEDDRTTHSRLVLSDVVFYDGLCTCYKVRVAGRGNPPQVKLVSSVE